MTTLTITVGERDRLDEQTRRRIEAAQRGEDIEEMQPVLNVGSYEELGRLLTQANLELLEAISKAEPESIREAADLVGRDYKGVHRNLAELEDIGIIEFEGGGSGRPKKPVLAYDGIEIDLPFPRSHGHVGTAAP